jgi:hypothetical protein
MTDFTPDKYWPLGSTVQETLTDLSDTQFYRHFGRIMVNPVNGHMVIIYRRGAHHEAPGDYGVICIRHSCDGGNNWSGEEEINKFTVQGKDLRNVAGGYDSNGMLFVFYAQYHPEQDPITYFYEICYCYSDNDGASWIPDNPIILPHQLESQNNARFSPYGQLIDAGNGILYQTWYGGNPDPINPNNPSLFNLYIYKSLNGGESFKIEDIILVDDINNPRPWGEPSMVNVGGGCFLLLARKNECNPDGSNEYNHFRQFKSEDNCATWTNQGTTTFEAPPLSCQVQHTYAAPPFLSFINYEGVGIVACYYTNRITKILKVVFGLAVDLLNGPDGWKDSTKKEIYYYPCPEIPPQFATQGERSGYQSFFLPNYQYKGICVCFNEIKLSNNEYKAFPVIVFTEISGMKDVLLALGL